MSHLTTDDAVDLYYDANLAGQGTLTLFSHGYGASARMWYPQTQAVRAPWLAWDNRGHGRTRAGADAVYTHDRAMEDFDALLDCAKAESAVLVGHSMGGYLSLAYALARPERVAGLVLVGAGPGFRSQEARDKWNLYANKIAERLENRGLSAVGDGIETQDADHQDAAALARAARGLLAHSDSRVMEQLGDVGVPVLVIVGEQDERFLPAAQYMARKIDGARYEVIAKAGHTPNLDAPAAFNGVMDGFLASLAG